MGENKIKTRIIMRKNIINYIVTMQFYSVLHCAPLMHDLVQLEWVEEQINSKTALTALTQMYGLGLIVQSSFAQDEKQYIWYENTHLENA